MERKHFRNVGGSNRLEWVPRNRGRPNPNPNLDAHQCFVSNNSSRLRKNNREFQNSTGSNANNDRNVCNSIPISIERLQNSNLTDRRNDMSGAGTGLHANEEERASSSNIAGFRRNARVSYRPIASDVSGKGSNNRSRVSGNNRDRHQNRTRGTGTGGQGSSKQNNDPGLDADHSTDLKHEHLTAEGSLGNADHITGFTQEHLNAEGSRGNSWVQINAAERTSEYHSSESPKAEQNNGEGSSMPQRRSDGIRQTKGRGRGGYDRNNFQKRNNKRNEQKDYAVSAIDCRVHGAKGDHSFQNEASGVVYDLNNEAQKGTEAKAFRQRTKITSQDWRFCQPSGNQRQSKTSTFVAREKLNRSDIPQLVQEIEEKLYKGRVECMICYDKVGRSAAIWSCLSCFAIFHLRCIKEWARTPVAADASSRQASGSNWRCPGCQSVQLSSPEDLHYTCFCGKVRDPDVEPYIVPHSCGGPCGKPLERFDKTPSCPHTCTLQCHPGPCPPCSAMAPPQNCPCGRTSVTRRCSDNKPVESCGAQCKKLLNCQRHHCEQICHIGPCSPCRTLINATCFCGKTKEMLLCGEMEIQGKLNLENGLFSCLSTCMKTLSCGNHQCEKKCHPGECGECELSPSQVNTCPCGKTVLERRRTSCLDPIPTCSRTCGKVLPCGKHSCKDTCHQGKCDSCNVSVVQKCRCGASSRTVPCWKTTATNGDDMHGQFTCQKNCGKKKNCGRHRCTEKCCPLATDGVAGSSSGDWDPHLCQMPCGKKLQCGQHFCQELCHKRHCRPCLETIFTDLTCACGKTSIPPPIPCGTPPPECSFPCSIPQPCGHQAIHNCHFGECPPCTVPVAKECVGKHVILKNVPCGSRDIRCNNLCGKPRQCGIHACSRTCHLPPCDTNSAECSSSSGRQSCGQTCAAPRRDCKHNCTAPCHPSSPCPDTRCKVPVTISCSCGRLTAEVPCDAGGSNVRSDPVLDASVLHKLPTALQPLPSSSIRVPLGQRKLTCDEECTKMERKKVLADAFGICTTVDVPGITGPVAELLADFIRREPQWISAVEDRFRYLVLGKSKVNTNSMRVHVFCPMPKEKRDMLRHLAERWGLSVAAAGWEPKRFLVVQVTKKSKTPARSILPKGHTSIIGQLQPLPFNASVDMDPRLVLAMFDLPREADVSSLILRFGGECELVWLNDKNALAVFTDPARAATALRRVDRASSYSGAIIVSQSNVLPSHSAWGTRNDGMTSIPLSWRKNARESVWVEDSWGQDTSSSDALNSVLPINKPITATKNPYLALAEGGEALIKSPSTVNSGHLSQKECSINNFCGNNEVDDWEDAFQ